MKTSKRILKLFILAIMVLFIILPSYTNATGSSGSNSGFSWSDIFSSGDDFLKKGEQQDSTDETKLQNIVVPIAQMLVVIGNIVVVIALAVMAIKYMISNPEDRAKLKSQLVGLAIATVVIFGAQFIWSTMYSFFDSI